MHTHTHTHTHTHIYVYIYTICHIIYLDIGKGILNNCRKRQPVLVYIYTYL